MASLEILSGSIAGLRPVASRSKTRRRRSLLDSTSPPTGLTSLPSAPPPAVPHTASCIVQATNSSQQLLLLISSPCARLYPSATVGEQRESSSISVPVCHLFDTPDWLSHHRLLINMQLPPPAPPLLPMP
ncbi:unnamed protein product [Pleuronectes platessa]|uniref:Uncharacterized protein n=1 Tax=Pleuronectes platessa TaxID=8262 RepID=A0A9N7VAI0_PLEPL|nr:unnamed protein product [Pleuronectes platessa]